MAIGFGFSVGDLCVGLKLIKESIEAIHDTKGSPAEYALLSGEIASLQDGLEAADDLRVNGNLTERQSVALDAAIRACDQCIEEFLTSISKYQYHLRPSASGFQANFRKIKWALCKKDDVARFRAQVARHASSINMLLLTFQTKSMMGAGRSDDKSSLIMYAGGDHLAKLLENLSLDQRQMFAAVMYQNKQLMQSMEEMKAALQVQAQIPAQILLQQPVTFLDPFGRTAPFHLDFIDSSECFMAVLKARFSNAGVTTGGLAKLENEDFLIRDTQKRRPINIHKRWSTVFRPGQSVDMSMTFHRFSCPPNTCPVCLEVNDDDGDDLDQIYCQECGLCYQNVQGISQRGWTKHTPGHDIRCTGDEIPYMLRQPGKAPELKVFRPVDDSEDDIFQGYRRVQLISQPLDLLDVKFPALQLIDHFSRFAELLADVPEDTSPFIPEIRALRARAVEHILQQRGNFPAFASFSQIEQVRNSLAKESLNLRRDIDKLVQNLYNDSDTRKLMSYIKEKYPSSHGKDYYSGVLNGMTASSDFTKSNNAKAKSSERMQWLLLDSRTR